MRLRPKCDSAIGTMILTRCACGSALLDLCNANRFTVRHTITVDGRQGKTAATRSPSPSQIQASA